MTFMSVSFVPSLSPLNFMKFRANMIPSGPPDACTQSYKTL